MIARGYKFYMGLYSEIFWNLLVAKHKNYVAKLPILVLVRGLMFQTNSQEM